MKRTAVIVFTIMMALLPAAVAEPSEAENQYETAFYLYTSERDFESAFDMMKKAAEAGNSDAQIELARYYSEGIGVECNETEALNCLKTAAEAGNAEAMYQLGEMFISGNGTEADPEKAVAYYSEAADNGNAAAMERLGYCYANGIGTGEDEARASEYYGLAAENGSVEAMRTIAFDSLDNGDVITAQEYFLQAATAGDAESAYQLGCIFAEGIGVDADEQQAISWWNRAADNGNTDAAVALYKFNHEAGKIESISENSEPETVKALQESLITIGYLQGEPNGVYDSETKEAVEHFQSARGIEATGTADDKTQAWIDHTDLKAYAVKISMLALRNADEVPELLLSFGNSGDAAITGITLLVIPIDENGEPVARYNEDDCIRIDHECSIAPDCTEDTESSAEMPGCEGVRGIRAAIRRVRFEDGSTVDVPDKMLNWISYK